MLVAFSLVNRLNLPAGEGGVGHETSFRSTYFCKKGRKRSPATQEGSNQYGVEIHLRMKATHILAPTRSALRVRRALFTNSHVSRKCRAYAVKSGFTPPEGNRYLLLISQMIAWRPHRCQWRLVTPQGFLVYPKSPKSEPFLAILGKSQNTPRESEKWRRCTLAYLRVETMEQLKP
jgi:hypothetical protein